MAVQWQSKTLPGGIRAITGGQGEPTILLSGWPETAETWSDVFETISKHHRFLALDPPGIGESAPPPNGYDTGSISTIMESAVRSELQDQRYHLVGHDVGAWIAYAWAAQFPTKIASLTILDVRLPGLSPSLPFPLPRPANMNLFQFSFNALPELPELLTQRREREFLTWFILGKVHKPDAFPRDKLEHYIRSYARPGAMSRGFEYYRAVEKSSKQNLEFSSRRLEVPVLALGGRLTAGATMLPLAELIATKAVGEVVDECGHFISEEQPEYLARRLLEFWSSLS